VGGVLFVVHVLALRFIPVFVGVDWLHLSYLQMVVGGIVY
jgi:hypothetical protein